jgi:hypothetical protein
LAPDNRLPGGKSLPPNFFNLWRGWPVAPDENVGSTAHFKDYLLNTVAGGDPHLADWLWNYIAHMIQRPWEKPGVAIVLRGEHGVGKSKLGEILRMLPHPFHTFQTSRIDELTGQFTAHVAGKLVLQFDEAVWGGDRRILGPLKDCITREEDKLEAKGADPIFVPSYCRAVFTTNADVAVRIEPGERRYTVFHLPSVGARTRLLDDGELAAIWRAAGSGQFDSIVRLLMLTGARREEIGGLRWSEIDLDRAVIVLPGERTKNSREHVVALSTDAISILKAQPRRLDRGGAPRDLVFGHGMRGYSGWSKSRRELDARLEAAGTPVPDFVLHDFRRALSTWLHEAGFPPHVVERLLGHLQPGLAASTTLRNISPSAAAR